MLDNKLFHARTPLKTFMAKVWRVVEDQENIATLSLVDSMQEQAELELLLDRVKPPYRAGTESMHYLIKTAFRYPPLKYGSRFGTQLMPSFFYASLEVETALTETAYYRFIFLRDMKTAYPKPIDSEHNAFSVSVRSDKCLDLTTKRYADIRSDLTHSTLYTSTQAIGHWAVEQRSVDLIKFESARRHKHNNIAVAEPRSIRSRKPLEQQKWICRSSPERISFNQRERSEPLTFTPAYFS